MPLTREEQARLNLILKESEEELAKVPVPSGIVDPNFKLKNDIDAIANAALQAATFNFGDEAIALATGTTPEERAAANEAIEANRNADITRAGLGLVGDVIGSLPYAGITAVPAKIAAIPKLGKALSKLGAAGLGALEGALSGAGGGETPGERVIGALTGATLGYTVPKAAEIVPKAVTKLATELPDVTGVVRKALIPDLPDVTLTRTSAGETGMIPVANEGLIPANINVEKPNILTRTRQKPMKDIFDFEPEVSPTPPETVQPLVLVNKKQTKTPVDKSLLTTEPEGTAIDTSIDFDIAEQEYKELVNKAASDEQKQLIKYFKPASYHEATHGKLLIDKGYVPVQAAEEVKPNSVIDMFNRQDYDIRTDPTTGIDQIITSELAPESGAFGKAYRVVDSEGKKYVAKVLPYTTEKHYPGTVQAERDARKYIESMRAKLEEDGIDQYFVRTKEILEEPDADVYIMEELRPMNDAETQALHYGARKLQQLYGSAKDLPAGYEFPIYPQEYKPAETSKMVEDAKAFLEAVVKLRDEYGIQWGDLHENNVMMRPTMRAGKKSFDYVATDVGNFKIVDPNAPRAVAPIKPRSLSAAASAEPPLDAGGQFMLFPEREMASTKREPEQLAAYRKAFEDLGISPDWKPSPEFIKSKIPIVERQLADAQRALVDARDATSRKQIQNTIKEIYADLTNMKTQVEGQRFIDAEQLDLPLTYRQPGPQLEFPFMETLIKPLAQKRMPRPAEMRGKPRKPSTTAILGEEEPTVYQHIPEFRFKPRTTIEAQENISLDNKIGKLQSLINQDMEEYIKTGKAITMSDMQSTIRKQYLLEKINFENKIDAIAKEFGNVKFLKPDVDTLLGDRKFGIFDKDDNSFKMIATLSPDGNFSFTIRTASVSPATGEVLRKSKNIKADRAFAAAEYFFGKDNIKSITGQWYLDEPTTLPEQSLSANAISFKNAYEKFLDQGLDKTSALNSAVRQTWTAKQAIRRGFSQSEIKELKYTRDGNLDSVLVQFTRPQEKGSLFPTPPRQQSMKPPSSSTGGIRGFGKYDELLRKRSELVQDAKFETAEWEKYVAEHNGDPPYNKEYIKRSKQLRNAEYQVTKHEIFNPTHEDLIKDYDYWKSVSEESEGDKLTRANKRLDTIKGRLKAQLKKYPDIITHIPEEHDLRKYADELAKEDPAIVKALEKIGYFYSEFMDAPQFGESEFQAKLPGPIETAIKMLRNKKETKQLPAPKKDK